MTQKYDLGQMFGSINRIMTSKLQVARATAGHPGDKGSASESDWVSLFNTYLPERYRAVQCHVIDSQNAVSEQIDAAIIDRQYTPFVWQHGDIKIVPVEAVYAAFEIKQDLNKAHIDYAHQKIASVRKLSKTSLPIPHAGGTYDPKPNISIIGGLLTLSSSYSPFFSVSAENALAEADDDQILNLGCVAESGIYRRNPQAGYYEHEASSAPVSRFMLELIAMLQELGTVPMIDVRAYADWINQD